MIHPTAAVALGTQVHEKASVGPWCVVENGVVLAEGVVLEARAHILGNTSIDAGTRIFDGAVVGIEPVWILDNNHCDDEF